MSSFDQSSSSPTIIDIRAEQNTGSESSAAATAALREDIIAGLTKPPHERTLPAVLLYDERGLRILDELHLNGPEYYLFAVEDQILRDHSKAIVKCMRVDGKVAVVVDLGAG